MNSHNLKTAEIYYNAIAKRDVDAIEKFVHPDIQLVSPLVQLNGKDRYLDALRDFTKFFDELKISATCGGGDQVMLAYDMKAPAPIGRFRAAALMTFDAGLVAKIELFFDARPFEENDTIRSNEPNLTI